MSDEQLHHFTAVLENVQHSIGIIADGHGALAKRLDELQDQVGQGFDRLEKKVGSLDTRIGSLEKKVGSLDTRIESLEKKVGSMDTRLGSVERHLNGALKPTKPAKKPASPRKK